MNIFFTLKTVLQQTQRRRKERQTEEEKVSEKKSTKFDDIIFVSKTVFYQVKEEERLGRGLVFNKSSIKTELFQQTFNIYWPIKWAKR